MLYDNFENILMFLLSFLGMGSMVSMLVGVFTDKKVFEAISLITIMFFCIIIFGALWINK